MAQGTTESTSPRRQSFSQAFEAGTIPEEMIQDAFEWLKQPGVSYADQYLALQVLSKVDRKKKKKEFHPIISEWEPLSFKRVYWDHLNVNRPPVAPLNGFCFTLPPGPQREAFLDWFLSKSGRMPTYSRHMPSLLLLLRSPEHRSEAFEDSHDWLLKAGYIRQAAEIAVESRKEQFRKWPRSRKQEELLKEVNVNSVLQFLEPLLGIEGSLIPHEVRLNLSSELLADLPNYLFSEEMSAKDASAWERLNICRMQEAVLGSDVSAWGQHFSVALGRVGETDSLAFPSLSLIPDNLVWKGMPWEEQEQYAPVVLRVLQESLEAYPFDERLLLAQAQVYARLGKLEEMQQVTRSLLSHPLLSGYLFERLVAQWRLQLHHPSWAKALRTLLAEKALWFRDERLFEALLWLEVEMGWGDLLQVHLEQSRTLKLMYSPAWQVMLPVEYAAARGDHEGVLAALPALAKHFAEHGDSVWMRGPFVGGQNSFYKFRLDKRILVSILLARPPEEAVAFLQELFAELKQTGSLYYALKKHLEQAGLRKKQDPAGHIEIPTEETVKTLIKNLPVHFQYPQPYHTPVFSERLAENTARFQLGVEKPDKLYRSRVGILNSAPLLSPKDIQKERELLESLKPLIGDRQHAIDRLEAKWRVLWLSFAFELFPDELDKP